MEENGHFGAILKIGISIPNSYQTFRLSTYEGCITELNKTI